MFCQLTWTNYAVYVMLSNNARCEIAIHYSHFVLPLHVMYIIFIFVPPSSLFNYVETELLFNYVETELKQSMHNFYFFVPPSSPIFEKKMIFLLYFI